MKTQIEKPMLFSSPMVRALLDGSKSQTRRVVKPQPLEREEITDAYGGWHVGRLRDSENAFRPLKCPHPVGSLIWVKETCWVSKPNFGDKDLNNCKDEEGCGRMVGYSATMSGESARAAKDYGVKQSPSIFMPRWASRITLEVTKVRVERLQDISEEDAIAEGVERMSHGFLDYSRKLDCQLGDAKMSYYTLWESIHGKGSWSENPWVWVFEFRRVKP